MPSIYENDFNEPVGWNEVEYGNQQLPSARHVSIFLFKEARWEPDEQFSGMLMQWGQFIGNGSILISENPSENPHNCGSCINVQPH